MANHGFITTKKWLTGDKVEEDFKQILCERFDNKTSYVRDGEQINNQNEREK